MKIILISVLILFAIILIANGITYPIVNSKQFKNIFK
jgi:hypothetical protein